VKIRGAHGMIEATPIQWEVMPNGCWEVFSHKKRTNGYVGVERDGVPKDVHRIAWERHFGMVPEGICVLHRCDNPPCWNPEHLFLGTKGDNNTDRAAKGRSARGEKHCRAKLTWERVREIRKMARAGLLTQCEIAQDYGVTKQAIWAIVHEKTWKEGVTT